MERKEGQIQVLIDGAPFTTLYFGPETMKPYLHPLRTADGTVITRRGPMEQVEGETKDHPHHQGLWFTHDDVNGINFWASTQTGPKHGKVELERIVRAKGGSKSGVIEAEFRWVGPQGPVLLERRKMTFIDDPNNRIIDFDITLKPASGPVKFGDTKEGTFAIRLSDKLTEKSKGGLMTNAEGKSGMKQVWGKRSPWVDYSGTLDGKPVGVAIFDHPSNPKHPTYWHSRDYGLFAANVFGEHDFYNDKTRDGSITLEPGKELRFRYRVVIHPGLTGDANLAAMYAKYK